MTTGLRSVDGMTPVSGAFDMRSAEQFTRSGPYWISLKAWVEVADVLAGGLLFGMRYDDPIGNTVDSPSTSGLLNLSDPTSTFSSAVEMIQLEDDVSLWELYTILAGSAGTAQVGYRVMVWPIDEGEYSPF